MAGQPPPTCEHKTNGVRCGKPAVCIIKTKEGKLLQTDEAHTGMGRGVGSLWLPICEFHKENYPDHEGMSL